jgi:hypothetical protein
MPLESNLQGAEARVVAEGILLHTPLLQKKMLMKTERQKGP